MFLPFPRTIQHPVVIVVRYGHHSPSLFPIMHPLLTAIVNFSTRAEGISQRILWLTTHTQNRLTRVTYNETKKND